jgi:hypothetical protein
VMVYVVHHVYLLLGTLKTIIIKRSWRYVGVHVTTIRCFFQSCLNKGYGVQEHMTIATARPLITRPTRHAEGQFSVYERCGQCFLEHPYTGLSSLCQHIVTNTLSPNQHTTHASGESMFPPRAHFIPL